MKLVGGGTVIKGATPSSLIRRTFLFRTSGAQGKHNINEMAKIAWF